MKEVRTRRRMGGKSDGQPGELGSLSRFRSGHSTKEVILAYWPFLASSKDARQADEGKF